MYLDLSSSKIYKPPCMLSLSFSSGACLRRCSPTTVAVATSFLQADRSCARRFSVASPKFIGRRSCSVWKIALLTFCVLLYFLRKPVGEASRPNLLSAREKAVPLRNCQCIIVCAAAGIERWAVLLHACVTTCWRTFHVVRCTKLFVPAAMHDIMQMKCAAAWCLVAATALTRCGDWMPSVPQTRRCSVASLRGAWNATCQRRDVFLTMPRLRCPLTVVFMCYRLIRYVCFRAAAFAADSNNCFSSNCRKVTYNAHCCILFIHRRRRHWPPFLLLCK